ncbi:hypothetical protein VTO73DRAFT_4547 [Trametes versicolor]
MPINLPFRSSSMRGLATAILRRVRRPPADTSPPSMWWPIVFLRTQNLQETDCPVLFSHCRARPQKLALRPPACRWRPPKAIFNYPELLAIATHESRAVRLPLPRALRAAPAARAPTLDDDFPPPRGPERRGPSAQNTIASFSLISGRQIENNTHYNPSPLRPRPELPLNRGAQARRTLEHARHWCPPDPSQEKYGLRLVVMYRRTDTRAPARPRLLRPRRSAATSGYAPATSLERACAPPGHFTTGRLGASSGMHQTTSRHTRLPTHREPRTRPLRTRHGVHEHLDRGPRLVRHCTVKHDRDKTPGSYLGTAPGDVEDTTAGSLRSAGMCRERRGAVRVDGVGVGHSQGRTRTNALRGPSAYELTSAAPFGPGVPLHLSTPSVHSQYGATDGLRARAS